MTDVPHKDNACSGRYHDWLEVNLTPACNGRCAWCVERHGWHPSRVADWRALVKAANAVGRKNVILLGGEPTLHPHLRSIVTALTDVGHDVWVTTNGSMLSEAATHLAGARGVNISVHDADLRRNEQVTGVSLSEASLRGAIRTLRESGASVRMNCTCIRGHVESRADVGRYVAWASGIGATHVRFAELKHADGDFVDLSRIFPECGANGDPYRLGCSRDTTVDGMPVNVRQMCGLQTALRPRPEHPLKVFHPVLYYDGEVYDGWQSALLEAAAPKRQIRIGRIPMPEPPQEKPDDQPVRRDKVRRPRAVPRVRESDYYGGGGSCMY